MRLCVKAVGVVEDQCLEIRLGDHALLDQVPAFGQRFGQVRHVPMPHIRRPDRIELHVQRIHAVVEGGADSSVIGFGTEVEAVDPTRADVLDAFDAGGREIVKLVALRIAAVGQGRDAKAVLQQGGLIHAARSISAFAGL
ncbi:hypothetical protein G6F59_017456 [Rhizopus arrhizus]|nr:hypothetical protein G6F59_017456 [Rhizopus arrhizus]